MIHELKTVQPFFDDTWNGFKDFEVRRNDRDYKLGDTLKLAEYYPEEDMYTGKVMERRIKYILDNPQFVKEGYVILGVE